MIKETLQVIKQIEAVSKELSNQLIQSNSEAQIFEQVKDQAALFDNKLKQIATAYCDFSYKDDQKPNETTHLYGIAAIDSKTKQTVLRLNDLKRQLKYLYKAGKFRQSRANKKALQELLNNKRFKVKQAYRLIPMIEQGADMISFSKSHTKSIKPLTWQEAYDCVLTLGVGAGITTDIEYLKANSNKQFAVVHQSPEHMRANIRVGEGGKAKRFQIKCSTPLLVYSPSKRLPEIRKPFQSDYAIHKRKNQYLSDNAVLLSINAYEYVSDRSNKWQKK